MQRNVLITGGTGLIGKRLTTLLQNKNYSVSHLSRNSQSQTGVKTFVWNPEKKYLESGALDNVDFIVHLAGTGIADSRWTKKRKDEILKSRTLGLELLQQEIIKSSNPPSALLSASGIAYYGSDNGSKQLTEQTPPGNDFLAYVTQQWEAAADNFLQIGIRVVKLRTGIVLSKKGGALAKMAAPARFGLGASLGNGQQWCSWIHLDDLCRMYINALEDASWQGAYNAVATTPVTNDNLTRLICRTLNKPKWLPNLPGFLLKIALGELATVVLGSGYVTNERIKKETDFNYQYSDLIAALNDVL